MFNCFKYKRFMIPRSLSEREINMIIDFHTHIFPDKIAKSALNSLSKRAQLSPFYDGTLGGLLISMKKSAIDLSVALPIATRADQTVSINNFALSVNQMQSRVISFGTMHPDFEGYKEEMDRLKENHIIGIKMHPVYQNFYVDDETVLPIYEYAAKIGLVLVVHGGIDIGYPGVLKCTPLRCRRVVDRIKGLKFVVAHMGGYECWDEVEEYLIGQKVYIDTSFSSQKLDPIRMTKMIQKHGADKMLFATDAPWAGQKEEVKKINAMPLSEEEKELIFHKNAENLLGLNLK